MSLGVADGEVCAMLGKKSDHLLCVRCGAAGGSMEGCSAMKVDVVGVSSRFKKKARGLGLGEVDGMLQSGPAFA